MIRHGLRQSSVPCCLRWWRLYDSSRSLWCLNLMRNASFRYLEMATSPR
uniref:Uncharacterized protein n=1 Tax=Arundo donax TaxID=35708 RepID=A0A0A8YBX8_ARUDO